MRKNGILTVFWLLFLTVFLILTGSVLLTALLAASIICMVLSGLGTLTAAKKVEVHLSAAAAVQKKEILYGEIRLENPSVFPITEGKISLVIHNMLTGEKKELSVPFSLAGRTKGVYGFQIRSRYCGGLHIAVKEVCCFDLFGLVCANGKNKGAAIKTTVLPVIKPIESDGLSEETESKESCRYSDSSSGSDPSERFGIREYIPGDYINHIHWKVTAKTEHIMVKELGLPIDSSLLLIFETGRRKEIKPEEADQMAEQFAGISLSLIGKGIFHTIGYYDREENQFQFREVGNEHDLSGILVCLLAQNQKQDKKSSLEYYLPYHADYSFGKIRIISNGEINIPRELDEYAEVITVGMR